MSLMRANREEAEGWDNLNSEEQRKVSSPWEEVCYWRKANQIRQWFVDNCNYPANGNCEEVEVTKEDLQKLVDTCQKVLNNHDLAEELLPCSVGFFFGSYEYDEWYFDELDYTRKVCQHIVDTADWEKDIIIYTDWW